MKLVPLTLLLSAASVVLADKGLYHICYNYHHSNRAETPFRHKAGGRISDAFATEIIKHMPEWSDHKYTAKFDLWTTAVYVGCSDQEPSKDEAVEAIKEQEKIVGEHRDG